VAQLVAGVAAADEILTLDGRVLQPEPPSGEFAARQESLLAEAEVAWKSAPDDLEAWIWVGRRQAYLGRYREAIDTYTVALERFPGDPRLLRHRGHRFISLRLLADAVEDLEAAATEVEGEPDEVEPDGLPNALGIPTSTLQTNIWYHLGLARYLQAEYDAARDAYRRCLDLSTHADMRVAASYWLVLAARRAGDAATADGVLAAVEPDLELIENEGYYELLRAFAGALDPAELLARASEDTTRVAYPTAAYGVGAWSLIAGERDEAERIFRAILDSPASTAFGYIAAEAELAR
jgi:tetratricopeptide (TPR) repeat protein